MAMTMVACASSAAEEPAADPTSDELVGVSTPCEELTSVPGMKIQRRVVDDGNLKLRVGVMDPDGAPKADVLFLHGFADRFDNHLPLFERWREAGLRVV
ncbi:MAG TPA: hypothetical protein VM925_07670, partial [Labilithrix sp.]|nr:hypothetical protein [Labilithrix sp.]